MITYISYLDVICTDYNADYDSSTGLCACSSGLTDTNYGCIGFTDTGSAAGILIKTEIIRRLTVIQAAGTWPKMDIKSRWTKTQSFWTKMNRKANKKAASVCGSRSQSANTFYHTSTYYCTLGFKLNYFIKLFKKYTQTLKRTVQKPIVIKQLL